jgi:pilus assembly protein Flp/PilA
MFHQLTKRFSGLVKVVEPLVHNERGAIATEYGILVSFLALALVLGVTAFGQSLNLHYEGMTTTLKSALGIP